MNVLLIPARGGSKRIPRKNVRPFAGKPMIAWSIEAALACGVADRVIVSTDDENIADVARAHGAEVPFMRPAALADDHATTMDVIVHALEALAADGVSPDYLCCLYATAPFVQAAEIRAALAQLAGSRFDYCFSATHFDYPVQRALRRTADGGIDMLYPQYRDTRSQDLEETLHDAGQFYWGRAAAFRARRPILSPAATPFLLPRWRVCDIDTPDDWARAERMAVAMGAQAGGAGA